MASGSDLTAEDKAGLIASERSSWPSAPNVSLHPQRIQQTAFRMLHKYVLSAVLDSLRYEGEVCDASDVCGPAVPELCRVLGPVD